MNNNDKMRGLETRIPSTSSDINRRGETAISRPEIRSVRMQTRPELRHLGPPFIHISSSSTTTTTAAAAVEENSSWLQWNMDMAMGLWWPISIGDWLGMSDVIRAGGCAKVTLFSLFNFMGEEWMNPGGISRLFHHPHRHLGLNQPDWWFIKVR